MTLNLPIIIIIIIQLLNVFISDSFPLLQCVSSQHPKTCHSVKNIPMWSQDSLYQQFLLCRQILDCGSFLGLWFFPWPPFRWLFPWLGSVALSLASFRWFFPWPGSVDLSLTWFCGAFRGRVPVVLSLMIFKNCYSWVKFEVLEIFVYGILF